MKKILLTITFILFALFFSFSSVYATDGGEKVINGIKETTNGASDMVQNGANNAGNAIKDGAINLRDGAENAANNAGDAMQNAGNNMKNTAENVGNDMKNMDNNYTATRTATENDANNTGNWIGQNLWTWIIIGIITIAIIALVWYFVSRNND